MILCLINQFVSDINPPYSSSVFFSWKSTSRLAAWADSPIRVSNTTPAIAMTNLFIRVTPSSLVSCPLFPHFAAEQTQRDVTDSKTVMGRSYTDCALFGRRTDEGVFFVTRIKRNADYEVIHACPFKNRSPNNLPCRYELFDSIRGDLK